MSAAPTLTWEQYQQLPPEQRRRPLTPAEYAALTKQQRIAAGLTDDDSGAPADFNGPVFPNPDHVQPRLDTDSAIPVTRLPQGVTFDRQNFSGAPQMDVSNPAAADVIPAMGREIGAQFSGQPVSTAATVPVFSPDGLLGDIPADQLTAAVKAGAKPGVHIVAPDGSRGVIPADRTHDAVSSGAKLEPIQEQPIQHPGFWATLGSDLGGMAKGMWHAGVDPLTDTHEDLVRKLQQEQASDQATENSPERKAHGAFYRNVTVPAAEAVGVNVPGMEQSAAEGDVGGVAGHAAAPVAAAAITSGALKMAGAVGEAADAAASSPSVRAAVKAAAKKLPVAAIRRIPYVGDVAADVYKAGSEAAANAKPTPELDATGENKPFAGGVDEIPNKVEPPAASAAPAAQPNSQAAAPIAPEPAAAAAKPIKAADVERALNESLGVKPLAKNVPLKNQPLTNLPQQISESVEPSAQPARAPLGNLKKDIANAANPLPEDFTATPDSSLLKGYKYDPAKQQFSAVLNNGESYTHGEVSPEQVKAFEDADSQGSAWTKKIKQGPGTVLMEKNGLPVKPVARTVVTDPQTGAPEFSDVVAQKTTQPAQAQTSAATNAEDLTDPLQQMLDAVNEAEASGKTPQSALHRLVKGEAGQAGLPGSVTDADEGITIAPDRANAQGGIDEIRKQPVIAQLTKQVPARGYLKMVGADENSVLKTQGDLDSVFYHRQQIAKTGQPPNVELHVDEGNNVIGTDGRHRAIAAIQQGGPKANVNVTLIKHPYPNSQ